jgi:hypothetical protein
MAAMTAATWIAALFALISVLGTAAFLTGRAFGAWRTFRRFTRAAGAAVDEVMRAADAAEAHATAAIAAGEFSATLARLRGVVPTK